MGKESFDWIVNAVANLAISKAKGPVKPELRWASLLGSEKKSAPKKTAAKSTTTKTAVKKAAKRK